MDDGQGFRLRIPMVLTVQASSLPHILLLTATLLLPNLGVASADDAELSKRLVGKWQVKYVDSERKRSSIAWTVYASNGMAASRSITKIGDKEINLVLEAKWDIIKGVLHSRVTKSSDTKIVKVGEKTQDKIVSIDAKELVYVDQEGIKVTELRVPDDKRRPSN